LFNIVPLIMAFTPQSPALTGVLLAVVPVVSLGSVFYGRFLRKIRKTYQDKLAEAGATAEESISQVGN
jgi:ABC-type multidrug transport system fused ATPase/permease subunit